MHTYLYNSIQQSIHGHLNVHKHVMIMSISHPIDIIDFTHIFTTFMP
ncbi:hypothetical protein F383_15324 [Gossypium arboreum]|uniref:Uncharacterized protein n=1 Tax=Gossypium arboreum TaxID=29729 RepID=A0A0B0NCL0_GOSAR|nr:hypothetical protein F383_15324 [Gossypium arboreum]